MNQNHQDIVTHKDRKGYLESLKTILISGLDVYFFVNLKLIYEWLNL